MTAELPNVYDDALTLIGTLRANDSIDDNEYWMIRDAIRPNLPAKPAEMSEHVEVLQRLLGNYRLPENVAALSAAIAALSLAQPQRQGEAVGEINDAPIKCAAAPMVYVHMFECDRTLPVGTKLYTQQPASTAVGDGLMKLRSEMVGMRSTDSMNFYLHDRWPEMIDAMLAAAPEVSK